MSIEIRIKDDAAMNKVGAFGCGFLAREAIDRLAKNGHKGQYVVLTAYEI